jgi:hypothetical protein
VKASYRETTGILAATSWSVSRAMAASAASEKLVAAIEAYLCERNHKPVRHISESMPI